MLLLFSPGFQARAILIESRLYIHNPELAVLYFALGCHGPKEGDRMSGNRNVWMVATPQQHSIAIANDGHSSRSRMVGSQRM